MTPTTDWESFAAGHRLISVFDTEVCDNNLGNAIIMDGVWRHLRGLFPDAFFMRLPYLDSIGREAQTYLRQSHHVFFGGTNALSSDMDTYRQWGVDRCNMDAVRDVVLMGVGWWQYQPPPTPATADLLRRTLSTHWLHAVRDSHTADMLRGIGIDNVLVTGCPSLWSFTDEDAALIPTAPADLCVTTLTSYAPDAARDRILMETLISRYRQVLLWVQGSDDLAYARSLGLAGRVGIIRPSLADYDAVLTSEEPLDYVGLRLHAGIRALCRRRRGLIIGIDNRAVEMGRDLGLPVLERSRIDRLPEWLDHAPPCRIRVPQGAIDRWKAQFQNLAPSAS